MKSGEAFDKSDFANNLGPDRPGIAGANRSAVSSRVTHGGNAGKRRAIEGRKMEEGTSIEAVGGKVKQVSERASFDVQNPRRGRYKLCHIAQGGNSSGVVLVRR